MRAALLASTAWVAQAWDGHMDWDNGWWIAMVLFWALVIVGLVWLVRGWARDRSAEGRDDAPRDVLDRRLAEGEVSVEEYEERRKALTSTNGSTAGKVPPAGRAAE